MREFEMSYQIPAIMVQRHVGKRCEKNSWPLPPPPSKMQNKFTWYMLRNISWIKLLISDCASYGSKMYELLFFKNIFVQLFWSSFCSFFLVFPNPGSRWSVTTDLQNASKILNLHLESNAEVYPQLCRTSKMKVFAKIVMTFTF